MMGKLAGGIAQTAKIHDALDVGGSGRLSEGGGSAHVTSRKIGRPAEAMDQVIGDCHTIQGWRERVRRKYISLDDVDRREPGTSLDTPPVTHQDPHAVAP